MLLGPPVVDAGIEFGQVCERQCLAIFGVTIVRLPKKPPALGSRREFIGSQLVIAIDERQINAAARAPPAFRDFAWSSRPFRSEEASVLTEKTEGKGKP